MKVAALAAVPLALLAARRLWSAYVLGATVALALAALVPPLFDRLADTISLFQAVRLAGFLPLPFALAGAAALAGRARVVGVGLALAGGIAVEFAYRDLTTGAAWAVWLAALGAACGLVACVGLRPVSLDSGAPSHWAAAAAVAFAVPIAAVGFAGFERWDTPDPFGLTPGLTRSLEHDVQPLAVVFAPSVTSYRIAGYAPVRVVVAPPGHVSARTAEDYAERQRAARLFFLEPATTAAERAAILRRYSVQWVVVDKTRGRPRLPDGMIPVFADERYVLYQARQEQA